MTFGLVLGAGGLPGEAFHRGVLHALRDVLELDGRDAELVVGTSAGSLVAASLRMPGGPPEPPVVEATPTDAAYDARRLPDLSALAGYALHPWRARPGSVVAALLPAGRQSTEILEQPLHRRFGSRWPAERTWVVAARRHDGRRVVFGRDVTGVPVAKAVAASCAIPGYFRPVVIDGEQYVDGGVHSTTNADLAAGEHLDLVVVSAPMTVDPWSARPSIDLGLRLALHAQVVREVAAIRRGGTPVLVVEPIGTMVRTLGISPVNVLRIEEIEEIAYEVAAERFTKHDAAA